MLVSEFLTNLKRRGQYQANQTVLADNDYIAFANDEMRMVICPKIMSVRENYFLGQRDYALGSSRRIRLPPRILGGRISKVVNIIGGEHRELIQTSISTNLLSGQDGYFMSEGAIVLTGFIPSGVLRVFYGIRPPKMVTTAYVSKTITAVGTSTITASSATADGTVLQIIRSASPFRTISPNVLFSGGTPFLTAVDQDCPSDPDRYQPGDFLITPDATHIVPLEQQLCDWLLQRTHMRVLQALGQTDQLSAAGSKLADIEKDCLALISPRVQNTPKVITGMQLLGWR